MRTNSSHVRYRNLHKQSQAKACGAVGYSQYMATSL